MTKLEKAVKGLELLKQRLILQADVLGYGIHISDIDNALALLKEQEPAKGEKTIRYGLTFWICNACDTIITEHDKFCRNCGRAVKWDDKG